jgi:hypothetical protein
MWLNSDSKGRSDCGFSNAITALFS